MIGEQLFRPVGAARVLIFRLAEELGELLIAFLLGVRDVQGHSLGALK
jgi:hypothetical protein